MTWSSNLIENQPKKVKKGVKGGGEIHHNVHRQQGSILHRYQSKHCNKTESVHVITLERMIRDFNLVDVHSRSQPRKAAMCLLICQF